MAVDLVFVHGGDQAYRGRKQCAPCFRPPKTKTIRDKLTGDRDCCVVNASDSRREFDHGLASLTRREVREGGHNTAVGQVMTGVVIEANDKHARMMSTASQNKVVQVAEISMVTG